MTQGLTAQEARQILDHPEVQPYDSVFRFPGVSDPEAVFMIPAEPLYEIAGGKSEFFHKAEADGFYYETGGTIFCFNREEMEKIAGQ